MLLKQVCASRGAMVQFIAIARPGAAPSQEAWSAVRSRWHVGPHAERRRLIALLQACPSHTRQARPGSPLGTSRNTAPHAERPVRTVLGPWMLHE